MTGSRGDHIAILCDGEPGGSLEQVQARAPVLLSSLRDQPPPEWNPEIVYLTEWPTPPWQQALSRASRLRWVHWGGVGVDGLGLPLSSHPDLLVSTSRGVFDQAMAEYALMLGLAALRDLWSTREHQRAQRWTPHQTRRLADSRVVVVGAGSIGRAVGRAFSGLGAEVFLVGSKARTDPEFGAVRAVGRLEEIVPGADLLVLVVPLTEETRGMIGRAVLDQVKPGAHLINLARGPVVIEDDLVAALGSGRLASAALDVFDTEPLPADHKLWTFPGIVVSPHMSAAAYGDWDRLLRCFVRNLDCYLAGEPPPGLVDLRQGFVSSEGLDDSGRSADWRR